MLKWEPSVRLEVGITRTAAYFDRLLAGERSAAEVANLIRMPARLSAV
jgi:hypothetical protein